jgi:hypothetical protein
MLLGNLAGAPIQTGNSKVKSTTVQPTTHKTRQWQLKSEVAPRTESKGKIQTRTEQEMRILADALRSTETTKIGGGGLTCELRSTETTKIGGGGLTCEDQTWEMKTATRQKILTRNTNCDKKNMRLTQRLGLYEQEHTDNKTSRSSA